MADQYREREVVEICEVAAKTRQPEGRLPKNLRGPRSGTKMDGASG